MSKSKRSTKRTPTPRPIPEARPIVNDPRVWKECLALRAAVAASFAARVAHGEVSIEHGRAALDIARAEKRYAERIIAIARTA